MSKSNKEILVDNETSFKTVILRLFAFLGDMIIVLSPVYIWIICFLLAITNVVGMPIVEEIMKLLKLLMVLFALFGNVLIALITKGASFGKAILGLKVVNYDGSECDKRTIVIRELVGKSLLFAIFIWLGNIKLLFLYALILGVVVLFNKRHLNIIDFITKTKVVVYSSAKKVVKQPVEVQEEVQKVVKKKEAKYNNIDLNVKSNFSIDGVYSVEELMKMAQRNGVKTLSICDRNNFKANIMAQKIAPLYGIDYVNGMSVDCEYKGNDVELLIYGVDNDDELCKKIEYEFLIREKELTVKKFEKLTKHLNIVMDIDKILNKYRYPILTNEMLASEILNHPTCQKEEFAKKYLYGDKSDDPIGNFVKDYLSLGSPCYVGATNPDIELVIKYFAKKDVKLVLAHPLVSLMYNPKYITEIIDLGIHGIEVYSPGHDREDIEYLLELAKNKNMEVTGGSYKLTNKDKKVVGAFMCDKVGEAKINEFVASLKNEE